MLATCHSIPGARPYLKHFGLGFPGRVPLLWALVRLMLFATAQQQHYFPPATSAAAAAATSEVLQARCSCVRHAEQVARWLSRVGGGWGGCHCTTFEFQSWPLRQSHAEISYENPLFQFMNFSKSSKWQLLSLLWFHIAPSPSSSASFLHLLGQGLLDGIPLPPILKPRHMQMYNAFR